MVKSIFTSLFIFALFLIINSCFETRREEKQYSAIEYLNVCEVTKNIMQYDKKVISLKASIKGFHELVLYDNNCPSDNNLIKIELEEKSQKQLFSLLKELNTERSDITGEIFITGKVEKAAGKLLYYKAVKVDLKDQTMANDIKNEILTVDQISCAQINHFIPDKN